MDYKKYLSTEIEFIIYPSKYLINQLEKYVML